MGAEMGANRSCQTIENALAEVWDNHFVSTTTQCLSYNRQNPNQPCHVLQTEETDDADRRGGGVSWNL
jgi:hypothetical protein